MNSKCKKVIENGELRREKFEDNYLREFVTFHFEMDLK